MASISRESNGRRTIQFVAKDGARKSIRLGKCSQSAAERVCTHVEALAAASMTGSPLERETAAWVATRDIRLLDKLAKVGLVPKREAAAVVKLGAFLKEYIAGRESKRNTVLNMNRAAALLKEHLGENLPLAEITPVMAIAWRDWMRAAKPEGKGLGVNSARRHVGRARQFFAAAVRRKLISENPFAELASSLVAIRTRDYFITRDEAQAVLDACPNAEWRLLFALSRFGGLRCPSEHFALRWQDVDWERDRITVGSPKTEHHAGKASRLIPIFPELRPHLEAAFDAAPEGAEFCISGIGSASPGTHMKRIIRRAGLTPWPKLFHNLRATRETELTEAYPIQTVVAWLGNSPAVALRHYLQVPAEHFTRAAAASGDATKASHDEAAEEAVDSPEERALRNPVQQSLVSARSGSQEQSAKDAETRQLPSVANVCEPMRKRKVPPAGVPSISRGSSPLRSRDDTPGSRF